LTEVQFANTTRDYWIDIVNPLLSLVSRATKIRSVFKDLKRKPRTRGGVGCEKSKSRARREKREGDRATAFLTRLACENR